MTAEDAANEWYARFRSLLAVWLKSEGASALTCKRVLNGFSAATDGDTIVVRVSRPYPDLDGVVSYTALNGQVFPMRVERVSKKEEPND